jgi:YidC/Oxa1 family membrane protein insertase
MSQQLQPNEQKRFFFFLMVSFLTMFTLQMALEQAGFFPKPKPEPAKTDSGAAEAPVSNDNKPADAVAKKDQPALKAAPKPEIKPEAVQLGSTDPASGYYLSLSLSNIGAGIASAESSVFGADHLPGKETEEKLRLIQTDPSSADSLTIEIRSIDGEEKLIALGREGWEVLRNSPDSNPVTTQDDAQSVSFRHSVAEVPGLAITKTYKLSKLSNSLNLQIKFESDQPRSIVYRLLGPYGLPLEGQWYSYTYRDLFYAPSDPRASLISRSAIDVARASDTASGYQPEVITTPLRYAGVETQYFANFVMFDKSTESYVAEVTEKLIGPAPTDQNKSNITVSLTSKPVQVASAKPVSHEYEVFLGPKTRAALASYGADDLTTYRRGWAVPGSRFLARSFIGPLLETTYATTKQFFGLFGATRGSYGLAIILLTAIVRLMIFPLSRKQAITSKRMQDLAPRMNEIKEKYKDDRERQGRETMELYRQAGVNPFSGCLIALIQFPVFMGLWQTLNNSVALRHAPFLYIDNLAAPDALFQFPGTVPFLGDYFNVLPIISVSLMYLQMKLFSPPPANAEAEMQQKVFTYMMVFMSFMFYKVPSGLGLYFITSSLWALGERLLLPKLVKDSPVPVLAGDSGTTISTSARVAGQSSGSGSKESSPAPTGWRAKWQEILAEAEKQKTIQNENRKKDQAQNKGKNKPNKGKR